MRVAIIGTGLMGTSVALAAQRRGDDVAGWDPDPAALAAAVAREALAPAARLEEAVGRGRADPSSPRRSRSCPPVVVAALAANDDATVTDVGSTKASVVRAADGSPRFVGGHPICGSETRGPENASAGLFEGATWFLTPVAHTDPDRHRLVHGFVSDLGATPVAIDADAHDRLVAMTSHVPHVLANIVANQTGASRVDGHEPLAHAGGSLRDMTRIAGANPRIWIDIFLDNAGAIRDGARGAAPPDRAGRGGARAGRRRLPRPLHRRGVGQPPAHARRASIPIPARCSALRVHVPDRPGVLAGITQALGAERINIEDFELHHVSPERGGTLTVLVRARARRSAPPRCSSRRGTASSSRR